LHDVGITARLVSPEQLVAINEANRDNWAPLISVIDHREYPTRDNEMTSLVGYDADGRAVATSVVRRFDFTGSTVGEELRSLRMLFGPRADAMAASVTFELTAPSADRISGQILYHGGVWVHPDCRKLGLTRIMPKLNRYFAMSQQHFDYEIAMASAALLKPHVAASYSVEGSEPNYAYRLNGNAVWDGMFNWSSRAWILQTLCQDLTTMAAESPLNYIGSDQQMPGAIA
jgi:hypothetical protein